jgi:hypothetical protein
MMEKEEIWESITIYNFVNHTSHTRVPMSKIQIYCQLLSKGGATMLLLNCRAGVGKAWLKMGAGRKQNMEQHGVLKLVLAV